ncbi:MAG: hypothetical protein HRT47_04530 [Candidatus Caenarcaniphilales bacterium]|nr:hypothetical protein [Candidatus Caenarcaniphilales bacterium]
MFLKEDLSDKIGSFIDSERKKLKVAKATSEGQTAAIFAALENNRNNIGQNLAR